MLIVDRKRLKRRIRQARYRMRQKAGTCIWCVEITQTRFDALVALGCVSPDAADKHAGSLALAKLLDMIGLP
jgi:hypothetical protein